MNESLEALFLTVRLIEHFALSSCNSLRLLFLRNSVDLSNIHRGVIHVYCIYLFAKNIQTWEGWWTDDEVSAK